MSNEQAKLQPFTKNDWDSFAGCESANPEVAYLDDYGEPDETGEVLPVRAAIVLDGKHVQVIIGECEDTYGGDYPHEAFARLVAEALLDPALRDGGLDTKAIALGMELL